MLLLLVFAILVVAAYGVWVLAECSVYLRAIAEATQPPARSGTAADQSPWVPADRP